MIGGSLEADRWESTSLGAEGIEMGEISIRCNGGNNHRKTYLIRLCIITYVLRKEHVAR